MMKIKSIRIASVIRYLILASAVLTFSVIVLGTIIRVTESGSACPDWPTCYGQWTAPSGDAALISYLHRFVSLIAGISLLVVTAIATLKYRRFVWIYRPLVASLGLLFVQVFLGRYLVSDNEVVTAAAIHLGLALAVQAMVLVSLVVTFQKTGMDTIPELDDQPVPGSSMDSLKYSSAFSRLSLLSLGIVFLLLVSGVWVAASGSTAACSGWPLCGPGLFPTSTGGWINLMHRAITGLAGIVLLYQFLQAWRTQRSQASVLVATTAAFVLFSAQALMGAVEVHAGMPAYLLGLHVATAAAVWSVLVVQVVLVGLADRTTRQEQEEAKQFANRSVRILFSDFLKLTKPIVVALLLVTTFAGMVVGAQAWPSLSLVFWTLLGGAMAAGGSGAINQYIDRYDDEKMQRTAHRPIPSGRLTPAEGLAFGVGIALASFYLLVVFVNFLAALLSLAGIIYYVLIYSVLLKKTTVQNIVIGGGAGAIPPLVGWAAVTGSLNLPSLFLFAVVFMWTPPHFWALALVRKNDYARAGVPMLPVVRGERETRWQIFLYTIELVALTLILPVFGLGGGIYLVSAILLGGALLYSAWKVWRVEGNKVAWKMYRYSSMYLAFLFLALMMDALL
jgi:heme o synthase